MLSIQNLSIAYEGRLALYKASLDVTAGQILGVAGPNGAGKSTLLRGIVGLESPTEGEVMLNSVSNHNRSKFRRAVSKVAYVSQKQSVAVHFPIRARQVIEMGLVGPRGWFGQPQPEQKQLVETALDLLELTHVAHHKFSDLSGGQQQKTLVGRAMVQNADLLILDEPFRGVDASSQHAIVQVLKRHRAKGGSVILVHHNIEQLADICDSLAVINRHVVACGDPHNVLKQPDIVSLIPHGPINRDNGEPEGNPFYAQPGLSISPPPFATI